MKMSALMTPLLMLGMKRVKPWLFEVLGAEQGLNLIRTAFVTSVAAVLVITGVLYLNVKSKNDTTPLMVKQKKPGQAETEEATTVCAYDGGELTKLMTRAIFGLAIGALLHIKWGFDEPLLLQAVLLPIQAITAPIVRIHLWGHPAQGELARPFKEASPFAALMGGGANAAPAQPTAGAATTAAPQTDSTMQGTAATRATGARPVLSNATQRRAAAT